MSVPHFMHQENPIILKGAESTHHGFVSSAHEHLYLVVNLTLPCLNLLNSYSALSEPSELLFCPVWTLFYPSCPNLLNCPVWTPSELLFCLSEPSELLFCPVWTFWTSILPCLNLLNFYSALSETFWTSICPVWTFWTSILPCLNLWTSILPCLNFILP